MKNEKVLITGGAGFIGSHLTRGGVLHFRFEAVHPRLFTKIVINHPGPDK
jgi:hypothetical protein